MYIGCKMNMHGCVHLESWSDSVGSSFNREKSYIMSYIKKSLWILGFKLLFDCIVFLLFCNLRQYLFNKVVCLEERAARYSSDYKKLQNATNVFVTCFYGHFKVMWPPLRMMLEATFPTPRNPCVFFRAPLAITTRFFFKFLLFVKDVFNFVLITFLCNNFQYIRCCETIKRLFYSMHVKFFCMHVNFCIFKLLSKLSHCQ